VPPASATPAAGPLVTYQVTSNGSLSSISYYNAMHEMQTILNVAPPWSLTFTSQATYPSYTVSAQTTGTEVACQIILNGQVVNQRAGAGRNSLAGCISREG